MIDPQHRTRLQRGIEQLDLDISDEKLALLLEYHAMLVKWNKAYNLTAVRDPLEMIDRHLLDSLSILPYICEERLIDVGSGPGLPGIPVAICKPDIDVVTMDSNGKKTRFQLQVKAQLQLDNLSVEYGRVEASSVEPAGQVISRAFASLEDMITWCHSLCREEGVFLAMKGLYPDAELAELPVGYQLKACHRLCVPGTDGERHLLMLGRA